MQLSNGFIRERILPSFVLLPKTVVFSTSHWSLHLIIRYLLKSKSIFPGEAGLHGSSVTYKVLWLVHTKSSVSMPPTLQVLRLSLRIRNTFTEKVAILEALPSRRFYHKCQTSLELNILLKQKVVKTWTKLAGILVERRGGGGTKNQVTPVKDGAAAGGTWSWPSCVDSGTWPLVPAVTKGEQPAPPS